MTTLRQQKKNLRIEIKERKKLHSKEVLDNISERVINYINYEPALAFSETVLLYHSLPDEVNTHEFIRELCKRKNIILPVVVGDILELRRYTGEQDLKLGSFNILEPCGELFTDYDIIDLAIIPGVAFDRRGNRLGRGKGYYDKLLPHIKAYKMGVCFPFQYFENLIIPTEPTDIPMNKVLTVGK